MAFSAVVVSFLLNPTNTARLFAALVLFLFSAVGSMLPFFVSTSAKGIKALKLVRPFACGVMFGVVFLHLLPDAIESLNSEGVYAKVMPFLEEGKDFPLAETMLLLGAILMTVIDLSLPCPHDHMSAEEHATQHAVEKRAETPAAATNGDANAGASYVGQGSTEDDADESTPLVPSLLGPAAGTPGLVRSTSRSTTDAIASPETAGRDDRAKSFSFGTPASPNTYLFTSTGTPPSMPETSRPPLAPPSVLTPASLGRRESGERKSLTQDTTPARDSEALTPTFTHTPSIKRGSLQKQSKYLKSWNPRTVALDIAGNLHWHGRGTARDFIVIYERSAARALDPRDPDASFKINVFGVQSDGASREVFFAAESAGERDEWVKSINDFAKGGEDDVEQGMSAPAAAANSGGTAGYGAIDAPPPQEDKFAQDVAMTPPRPICRKTTAPIRMPSADELILKSPSQVCSSWATEGVVTTATQSSEGKRVKVSVNIHEIMKVYAMEGAIAAHSIIVGFSLGVSAGDNVAIATLAGALVLHQMFEGIALGLAALEANLGKMAYAFLCIVFSTSIAVGVVLGVIATSYDFSSDDSGVTEQLCRGIPNAIGAGMLMIIAGEFYGKDFGSGGGHDGGGKLKTFLLGIGGGVMAVLAVWA